MMEENLSMRDIIIILKKRWEVIVGLALSFTIIAIVLSFFIIVPTYEARSKIFMGKGDMINSNYNDSDVQMNKNLIKTYAELVQTNDFIEKTIKEYDINITSEEMLKRLTVIPDIDTQILEIKAIGKDKYLVEKITESISSEFVKESKKLIPYNNAIIIENVKLPKDKKNPNEVTNISIGFILGLMFGVLVVIFLENFNNRINTKEKLEKVIDIPVIGSIPQEKIKRRNRGRRLAIENNCNSIQSEAYRQLRNNISYSFSEEGFSIIAIISPEMATGKSIISSNIALAFSEINKNVVIVDCNLRNPSLHKIFNISNMQGLSDVFIGKEKVENVIKEYSKNMSILTCGKVLSNSSEMLGSNIMSEVLECLKNRYDLIILDTASIQNFTDTHLLSTKADGNVFVVKAEKTKIEALVESKKILDKIGAKIIGTVLN